MPREETRRQMTALVRRWQRGPDPQAVFAERHGISRTKLRYWVRRVGRAPADAPVAFTPVHVLGPAADMSGPIDIVLVGGERVVVRDGASLELLRTVLAAVRPAC